VRTSRPARAIALIAALLAALGLAACSGGGTRTRVLNGAAAGRPNIVFVLTDDLSTDLVQYMPHVRALAQGGLSFSNYFVVDSLCCPSRAAILTGQYPHNTKVYFNSGPRGGFQQFMRVGDADKTFGTSLQKAGYRTAFMGKYLNHYPPDAAPPPGWDEWDVTGSEGYREFNYHLNENGHVHHYGSKPHDYLTDVLSERAGSFIDKVAKAREPFALEVATYAPHAPSTPAPIDQGSFPTVRATRGPAWDRLPAHAPPWLAGYPRLSAKDTAHIDAAFRRRVESVQAVDRMVGRLQDELRARGLLKNTFFVFSSDNGFHMGQYRMLPGKQTAFDTDIRVPLVVTGPGVPAGRTTDTLVSSIDLAPTFEQIGGAHATSNRDGASLLGIWRGQPAPEGWARAVLIEHKGPANRPDDPDRQVARAGLAPSYSALRTPDSLYVEYVTGDREYYDLRRDPNELDNIVSSLPAARLAELHRMLHALVTCKGTDCRSRTQPPA
jgi:arylsulfatase A-like enzyme